MLKLWQNRSIGRLEKKDKIDYWFDIALYDLQTAEAMLNSNRYLYVVFMCQQAIEKLIKAVFIDKLDKEPPRSHNISFIFLKLGIPAEETQLDFFDYLTSFYIEGRYPEYKAKLSGLVDRKKAETILNQTKENFEWLKSHLT